MSEETAIRPDPARAPEMGARGPAADPAARAPVSPLAAARRLAAAADEALVAALLRKTMGFLAVAAAHRAGRLARAQAAADGKAVKTEDRDVRHINTLTLAAQRCKEMTDKQADKSADMLDPEWRRRAFELIEQAESELRALVEEKRALEKAGPDKAPGAGK
ncbi:hypothetical protein [Amphiplicatus metriothermophilus]|nr:hypothetical protein [Amphiplicatus metriothermophilus]MBB5518081.1 hypothetical protein [Amphiplicatus metriothermophilus]